MMARISVHIGGFSHHIVVPRTVVAPYIAYSCIGCTVNKYQGQNVLANMFVLIILIFFNLKLFKYIIYKCIKFNSYLTKLS